MFNDTMALGGDVFQGLDRFIKDIESQKLSGRIINDYDSSGFTVAFTRSTQQYYFGPRGLSLQTYGETTVWNTRPEYTHRWIFVKTNHLRKLNFQTIPPKFSRLDFGGFGDFIDY